MKPNEKRGWLYAPQKIYKRIKCGAVYGHRWAKIAEDLSGHVACVCVRCGAQKVFH